MQAQVFVKTSLSFVLPLLLLTSCSQSQPKPILHRVEIKEMKFQPANLTVNKGDTVLWINRDIVVHDISQENMNWASPALASNGSWKKVITQSDKYYCSVHVIMKGAVTVAD